MAGFLMTGDAYIKRINADGSDGGYVQVGASEATIEEKTTIKERKGAGKTNMGQILSTAAIKEPATFAITLTEASDDVVAMALLGTKGDASQGAGSASDEAVTAKLGGFVRLAKGKITGGTVVVTNSAGTVTYDEGTDYDINHTVGMIMAKPGGAIADDAALKVNYDYEAWTGTVITGSTQPTIRVAILLDGRNHDTGEDGILEVDEVTITPEGGMNFIKTDFGEVKFKGSMKTLAGKDGPYTFTRRDI